MAERETKSKLVEPSTLSKTKKPTVKTKVDIDHVRYDSLTAIAGHKYFFVNTKSNVIYYKKGSIKFSTKTKLITEAKKFVDIELRRRESGLSEIAVERSTQGVISPSCTSVWAELMALKKAEKKESTMKTYNKSWKIGLAPFIRDIPISSIDNNVIASWRAWYLNKHPKRDPTKTIIHFGMLLRYAFDSGLIARVPTKLADLKSMNEVTDRNSKKEEVGRVLTDDEIAALEDKAKNYQELTRQWGTTKELKEMTASRIYCVFMIAAYCGARKMEICQIEVSRINFEKSFIQIWSDKNKEWRDIPLIPKVLDAVRAQTKFSLGSKYLFPMPSDPTRSIYGQMIDDEWVRIKELAGITGRCRFHDLRHTFATKTAENGWPVIVACEVLDQSVETYQNTYCKTSRGSKSEWMNKLWGQK